MSNMSNQFEADTGKILDIVINSLYSEREIFLRELISNASDALDKRKYLSLTDKKIAGSSEAPEIKIEINNKEKTLTISDNGIGMNEEDLKSSLGTIARSGTKAFLEQISKNSKEKKSDMSMIGQFGVGFYASFMVADNVEVVSKKAGEEQAWKWFSDGKTGFNLEKSNKDNIGTSITLSLKKDAKEFLGETRVQFIVRKYSDHISYPVKFLEIDKKDAEVKTLNEASALWTRPTKEITEEQYQEFFSHIGAGYGKPLLTMHNNTEGTTSYTNLICIPSTRPFDLFNPDRKSSLKLYINRVFITDKCDALIPSYLRFVKGLVDTQDIDLNVSREMLQNNPAVAKISKSLVGKIIRELKKVSEKNKEGYNNFWKEYGAVLKEGLYEDAERKDNLLDLCRFSTNESEDTISLAEYLEKMPETQKDIYYIAAETNAQALASPHLEGFKSKNIPVLIMTDAIDQFWLPMIGSFKEKKFTSITQGQINLDDLDAKTKDKKPNDKEEKEKQDKQFVDLIAQLKVVLGDQVKDIRLSSKLTDSPVCLVADDGDMDIAMEHLMAQRDTNYKGAPRILEINGDHLLIKNMKSLIEKKDNNDLVSDAGTLLFEQARLMEGKMPADPAQFSKIMNQFLLKAIPV
ncbi:molecular chaperone HtpG [Alphaproteobacteria bacterium]|jgi:molecular chaperone HtpG|nr:molecular chaperone HtpG [Candidatus Neomarinimicrobiota bacterium]MCH1559273.1 molecular chaperone HtpG [Alphaproteobacteria bacterium]MDA9148788.1 molecular chaperone HtpG [Alphaproteobacteria bacterium]MDA9806195.1 molecular chaperone HtpG [Alphaproteobacteria bacterium]MDB2478859.1 molecular chaperone HtpG [Alphaproteobacteria bacterium]